MLYDLLKGGKKRQYSKKELLNIMGNICVLCTPSGPLTHWIKNKSRVFQVC